ncbi:MAG: CoB--CoM heterodisulfide reductase iron-sulfur subunit B family protein [Candidatus Eisenbacteria bacterium]|nr:CoB--CoM heterodisulfide reductase iron-sulfur subunit B family protein [Candidatus Eisenbacteria bacterium]
MRLPYYPGCTLKTTARNLEDSALAVAQVLGIELVELPRWNCCGVVTSLTDDDLMRHLAPVRNLIRVQEMNAEGLVDCEMRLVTLCSMCFNTLKRTNMRVIERADDLKSINDFMYLEEDYEGGVEVVHFLEILRGIDEDRIRSSVKQPLEGLRVAPYYGCTLLRPKGVGIDDPERPTVQDDLIRLLGVEVVDNPRKSVCCGSYQTVGNKYAVADLAYEILTHARAAGADVVATFCPLCAFNLDNRQREVVERHPDFEPIPVLYTTQLMALAFGLGEEVCRFDLNDVDPRSVLDEARLVKEES